MLRFAISQCLRVAAPVIVPRTAITATPLSQFRFLSATSVLLKRNRKRSKFVDPIIVKHTKSSKASVELFDDASVAELATSLDTDVDFVTDKLLELDDRNIRFLDGGKSIDKKVILDLCSLVNVKPKFVFRPNEEKMLKKMDSSADAYPQHPAPSRECVRRAPVVTIMGHVDHGKTTLLDALRHSSIVKSEFGGITQHIGAFSVRLPGTQSDVTFLDTPGHAAFAAMRERGARATDIVVLVVAADDGVNEQTVESIRYAREAGVPLVVAINKIDKPNADPQKTRRDLMQHEIVVEDMGGDVQVVEISALQGTNLKALQEALILQAELMDLKAPTKGLAEGVVIEATTAQGLGKVCTMVVQRGTLKKGDVLVAGTAWGRVRTMTDDHGKTISSAGPSTPVRIAGWRDNLPTPGDRVLQVENEHRAQEVVDYRAQKSMDEKFEKDRGLIDARRQEDRQKYLQLRQQLLDSGRRFGSTYHLLVKKQEPRGPTESDEKPILRLMIRSDVDGTLEAILNVLDSYSSDLCELQIVDFGVGPPIDNHIELAAETEAVIYCFNTAVPAGVRILAGNKNVTIEQYNVIYHLVDGLKERLSAKIPPKVELRQIGEGHVLKEFLITNQGRKKLPIAGCLVDWGVFNKQGIFRISRKGAVVYEGQVESLKCENEFVNSAKTNTEVGLSLIDKAVRFKEDDTIEVFEEDVVPQKIDWHPQGF